MLKVPKNRLVKLNCSVFLQAWLLKRIHKPCCEQFHVSAPIIDHIHTAARVGSSNAVIQRMMSYVGNLTKETMVERK